MRDNEQTILLVEDDALLADITAFRLELLGFQVQVVENATDAFQVCQSDGIDVIIVDLELAGMKGLDLINQLQVSEYSHSIPILVFSADPNLDVVHSAFKAGAKDYLVTPYDPAVLEDKIERLINPQLTN